MRGSRNNPRRFVKSGKKAQLAMKAWEWGDPCYKAGKKLKAGIFAATSTVTPRRAAPANSLVVGSTESYTKGRNKGEARESGGSDQIGRGRQNRGGRRERRGWACQGKQGGPREQRVGCAPGRE